MVNLALSTHEAKLLLEAARVAAAAAVPSSDEEVTLVNAIDYIENELGSRDR